MFWIGFFAALTVWNLINLLLSMILFDSETTIDRQTLLVSAFFTTVFGVVTWYIATFGGGL